MARLLARIVLILGALLLPLWIGAALGFTSVVREAVSTVEAPAQGTAPEDRSSMAPADCPENDTTATGVAEIDDDDDADPSEVLPAAGAPRVHRSDRSGPARVGQRAGAGPPIVHLDVQTPPPKA